MLAKRRLAPLVLVVLLGHSTVQGAGRPLPPLKEAARDDVLLISNSGFEEPGSKAWRFSDWPPRPKTGARAAPESILYSQDIVHSGKHSVCIDHTTVGPDRILLVQQGVKAEDLKPHDGGKLRLSLWVWVARGPAVYGGSLGMRQWGERGRPPFGGCRMRFAGRRGEWTHCSKEFPFRFGDTRRADITVGLRATPDQAGSPVCYVDDVKLEALSEPALVVESLGGQTLSKPDTRLPLRVRVAPSTWGEGLKHLRCDVTSPAGTESYAHANSVLDASVSTVEVSVPALSDDSYAIRAALGAKPNERTHETLIPIRLASGPFVR